MVPTETASSVAYLPAREVLVEAQHDRGAAARRQPAEQLERGGVLSDTVLSAVVDRVTGRLPGEVPRRLTCSWWGASGDVVHEGAANVGPEVVDAPRRPDPMDADERLGHRVLCGMRPAAAQQEGQSEQPLVVLVVELGGVVPPETWLGGARGVRRRRGPSRTRGIGRHRGRSHSLDSSRAGG